MLLCSTQTRRPTDHGQEFAARLAVVAEGAQHAAGHHGDVGLVHAARGHALVRRLDDDGDAARLQHFLQRVGDLRRELLLDLQAVGVGIDHAGELADADDAPVGQVADMDLADDRHHVVLAMRFEADVAQHHDLVVALDLLEGPLQHVARILIVAGEEFLVGAHDAIGRADQTFAVGIVAGPADQRADRLFGFLARGTRRGRWRARPSRPSSASCSCRSSQLKAGGRARGRVE